MRKKEETRSIGDNQFPMAEEAIKFIKSIYEDLMVQREYSEEAVFGKNKTDRENNANWANSHLHNQILKKFRDTDWVVTKWDKAKGLDYSTDLDKELNDKK